MPALPENRKPIGGRGVALVFAAFALVDVAAHAPEVAAGEKAYIAIYVPGGFFTILSGVLAGLLTGQGRTGWVSVCGVAGVLVNIAAGGTARTIRRR